MKRLCLAYVLMASLMVARGQEPAFLVNDHAFEDFREGKVDGAGLMVCRSGGLRWVNWFDLNRDGWNEIVVNNDHNHYETPDAFLYRADDQGRFASLYSPLRGEMPLYQVLEQAETVKKGLTRLPSLGGGRAHVADLNGDGWVDVVFNNFVHGWSEAALPTFVYWGSANGFSADRRTELDAFRGCAAASADLDGNGLVDLIVANGGREYLINKTSAPPAGKEAELDGREGSSWIFYQDEAGYSDAGRKPVPTRYAIDVRTADFDRNGFADLAFLEAGKPGRIRIFLNGPKGLSKTPVVLPVTAPTWGKVARECLVADLDGDGWADIFAPSEGESSEIFWNGPQGFSPDRKTLLPTSNAYSADVGDLNQDGLPDLVVANYSLRDEVKRSSSCEVDSRIYWGDKSRFFGGRSQALPTSGATGVRVVDLDEDGRLDVAFSQHRDADSFDVPSVVFMNSPSGFHAANRRFLGTFGAVDVEVVPGPGGGLFFSNRQSGFARYTGTSDSTGGGGETDSLPRLGIFWGSPPAVYGPGAMTLLPAASPETSLVCSDINFDGFAELIYLRGKADELRVRFGGPAGFEDAKFLSLELGFRGKSLVAADFNRDGYVDVVVTGLDEPILAFFAGTPQGFSPVQKFALKGSGQSAACGDLDGDGILDLAIVGKGTIQILPGDRKAVFDDKRITAIETKMFSSRVCVADLNSDGQLDLFVQNFSDSQVTTNSVPSWVLFNERGAFSLGRKTDISSHGATGGSVADLNRDGNLDLVVSNYHGNTNRHVSLFLYYGEGGGRFSARPVRLPAYSSSSNLVLDLNNDGFLDIVVFNHSESTRHVGDTLLGGVHGTGSVIYWGAAKGFSKDRKDWFPSFGPHSRINADPGNVRNRSSAETYVSRVTSIQGFQGAAELVIKGAAVAPQKVGCKVRFDDGKWAEVELLPRADQTWRGEVIVPPGAHFQYMLTLDSGNMGVGPAVHSVTLQPLKNHKL